MTNVQDTAEPHVPVGHDCAELARSNRELEEFAYVASHDLKTPLLVVMGFLDLLERTKIDQFDEDARSYIAAAQRGAARMEQLMDDLLTYSRVGRNERHREWMDLGAIVKQALVNVDPVVQSAGANVIVGPLPCLEGNRTLLGQVFDNLIMNAIKYRRPEAAPVVQIDASERVSEWVIRVTDNGVGVPLEHRDSVFTMFKRLEQSADVPGSGIGLAICHRVVLAHGGSIWVDESDNGGTQVCFTLPSS